MSGAGALALLALLAALPGAAAAEPEVIEVGPNTRAFARRFDQDRDHPRLVLLLSPG